ncbi:right-handed parallel beta-helix repeat-containing protein [Terracoccus luteus]|uniref:Parallel beta-helix repeat protein n=1 Tax=Terracoccus luteus TaxID=53356 RepID=A0A839PUL1_9MICO|nr:right-handed parallel beta-helix repeat-containing protein [Terracoccus luteus]MBB2985725.1 parallel beta-helix repeat protein [Terracoccus luteus]MCP2171377.1 parallel beta-helix repeat protein [Terracoccus luteus]
MNLRRVSLLRKGLVTAGAFSLALAVPAIAQAPHASADPAPTDTIGGDTFERTVSAGWGTALTGGTWGSSVPSRTSVSSGQGLVRLDPGASVTQTLAGSAVDVRTTVGVKVDRIAVAGNGVSAGVAGRVSGTGGYVANLRIGRAGAMSLAIVRMRSGSPDTVLVNDTLIPGTASTGTSYTAQVDVMGTSPVVVRARAWPTSSTAPGWQVSTSDASDSRITSAGGSALRSYLSASSASTGLAYDNVAVQRLAEPGGTTPAPVPATPQVGSAAPGGTYYSVPSGAIFVTAAGSRAGSGTAASPYGSLAYAIERAPSGATLVMRGGTYRESTTVPFGKRLTIQSYPGEAVWLEGSSPVTGWQKSGSTWAVSGWNYIFDHKVSHTRGVDESNRFIDPAYPMAGYPDQVWVGGVKLRQVGSASAVVGGTFYVDEAGRRLVIGSDPAGRTVEASTRQQAMVIQGAGTVVRGIGVRRYANTFWMGGALSAQVDDITLENVVASDNATIGINGWGKRTRLQRVTVARAGGLGVGMNRADGLSISDSLIQENNVEHFKEAPVSGGVKITTTRGVSIRNNLFERNVTTALWFDESAYDITIANNTVRDNAGIGIELELSSKAVVAGNYIVRNGSAGLYVIDTNNVAVWNNTFAANQQYSWRIYQDSRRSSDPVITFVVRDISFRNNVTAYGTGACPYLVHDTEYKVTGQTMRVTSQANAYWRASSSAPANMVCWANGTAGLQSYKTLSTFRSATGNDTGSTVNEGTPILTSDYQLTPAAQSTTAAVALPLPDYIASVVGLATNTRKLGAVGSLR